MTERLREIVATDDPALAELVRMVRAAGDVDPRPGAQDRVRRALAERPPARHRWRTPLVVAIVLLVVLPVAIAGVHRLVSPPAPAPSPPAPASRVTSGAPHAPQRSTAADEPVRPPPAPARDATPEVAPGPPRATPGSTGTLRADRGTDPAGPPAPGAPMASVPQRPAPAVEASAPTAPVASRPSFTTAAPAPAAATPVPVPAPEPGLHLPGPAGAHPVAPASPAPARVAPGAPRLSIEPGARPAPAAAPDAALAVDAMRQLRRGHDPRAALRGLDAYLDRFPDGDLAEEVLALAIEARTALGDPAACSLAEQYLQRYPRGRFRDHAERARLRFRAPDLQRCPAGPARPRDR